MNGNLNFEMREWQTALSLFREARQVVLIIYIQTIDLVRKRSDVIVVLVLLIKKIFYLVQFTGDLPALCRRTRHFTIPTFVTARTTSATAAPTSKS